jgi:hypothetical protein
MAFSTRENGFTPNRHTNQYVIECDVDSTKICDIMNIIMVKHCKVSVCGYNILDDEYWGKKYNKNVCELDFQIAVKNLGHNNSNVVIKTTVGAPKIITELFNTVKSIVRLCEMMD